MKKEQSDLNINVSVGCYNEDNYLFHLHCSIEDDTLRFYVLPEYDENDNNNTTQDDSDQIKSLITVINYTNNSISYALLNRSCDNVQTVDTFLFQSYLQAYYNEELATWLNHIITTLRSDKLNAEKYIDLLISTVPNHYSIHFSTSTIK